MQRTGPQTQKRARDYPMPSIAHVLTNAEGSQFRLPSYRFSHQLRYHPYPRFSHHNSDPFMETTDHRSDTDHSILTSSLSIDEEDTIAGNIYAALNPSADAVSSRIRRLSIVVIDLALAVTRKMRQIVRGSSQDGTGDLAKN